MQAEDIGIYRELKDYISASIDGWKRSNHIQYTNGGNPKPPSNDVVRTWVLEAWRQVSLSNIMNSILAAGFANSHNDWHISKHDVYGTQFTEAWHNSKKIEVTTEDFECYSQDDELTDCIFE